jgi:hypothetical protein
MKKAVFFSLMILVLTSCSKNVNNKKVTSDSFDENYKVTSSTAIESSKSFNDIFVSIEKGTLLTAISNEDKETLDNIINVTNDRIIETFKMKYHIDLNNEFDSQEKYGITLIGVYYAARERYLNDGHELPADIDDIKSYEYKQTFDCFLTAVSAAIGITDAKKIWKSIIAGASEQTVIATIRLVAKRVTAIIAVGILVYQVGNCLDWW